MNRRTFLASSSYLLANACLKPLLSLHAAPLGSGRTVRVAVIGHTGRGNYGHGLDTMWLRVPSAQIVAVSDPDPTGLSSAQKRLGSIPGFTSYREMLESTRPDLVAICPRHIDQHHAMLLDAIGSGARGIYMEKPFVRTPAEADEVLQKSLEHGVKIAIAHRNRYHPAVPVLANRIAAGDFGTPLEIRARGKEDHRSGGLDLWVLGSHVLNLATAFAGPPKACTATVLEKDRPSQSSDVRNGEEGVGKIAGDEIHARFEMESGIPLFFESKRHTTRKPANFGLQITCSDALIDLRVDTEPLVHVLLGNPFDPSLGSRQWLPFSSGGLGVPEPHPDISGWVAGHLGPAHDLITCMDSDKRPLCDAEAGRQTVEMIQAIFTSHRASGCRVTFPLPHRGNAFDA